MSRYRTYVFDCDGVVLNSNAVKTAAFHSAARGYGFDKADELAAYHVRNGGISRYRKFEHFLSSIVGIEASKDRMEQLLADYAHEVLAGLLACEIAPGLAELRQATVGIPWLLVSGGDQAELRQVFAARGIEHWFDGGIFGSPESKDIILRRELDRRNLLLPALFFGDSRYDYEAASTAGLDFAFVSGWTEFRQWREYFARGEAVFLFSSVADFLHELTPVMNRGASTETDCK